MQHTRTDPADAELPGRVSVFATIGQDRELFASPAEEEMVIGGITRATLAVGTFAPSRYVTQHNIFCQFLMDPPPQGTTWEERPPPGAGTVEYTQACYRFESDGGCSWTAGAATHAEGAHVSTWNAPLRLWL
jgi:hypothetical protein